MRRSPRPSPACRARAEALSLAIALCTLLAVIPSDDAAAAERRMGRVTHVLDGDTIDVLVEAKRLRVRLAGITAPAPAEPFGLRSRQSLVQLCGGEIAVVDLLGKDREGRALGRVSCAGTDANAEQVRRGLARVPEHDAAHVELAALQAAARAAHRGIWSTRTTVSPSARQAVR